MTGERTAEALFLVLALTLPVSALLARRVPGGRIWRMAMIWGLIFLAVALIAGVMPLRHAAASLHNIYYQTERQA